MSLPPLSLTVPVTVIESDPDTPPQASVTRLILLNAPAPVTLAFATTPLFGLFGPANANPAAKNNATASVLGCNLDKPREDAADIFLTIFFPLW